MDRSFLARKLRSKGYPKADQAVTIAQFLAGDLPLEPLRPSPAEPQRVALFGYAFGEDRERIALSEDRVLDWIDLPRGMRLRGDFFVIQMVGGAMEPRIRSGERKVVQRGVSPGPLQDAVIEFRDGSCVLKTYEKERDGYIFARQYNPERELRYPGAEVRAIHAVLAV
jgi:phage repressor protein C with HTH and peptisase S24 domain